MKRILPKYRECEHPEHKGRDNKDYYNTRGADVGISSGFRIRVPSISRNKKTWANFYRLFPHLQEMLQNGNYQEKIGDVLIVREKRIHGGITRVRTIKYRKIW